jgi:electron transport complex protein RnfB
MLCGFGALLAAASRYWRADSEPLVDAIDSLLPQTQCAQCGYPGCRPYAAAIAQGAALNLCPPGGNHVHQALTRLLGAERSAPPQASAPQTARIDESQCIGCFLCVEACPVDAIIGAPRYMHTVVQSHCTGCELCIEPCPVDCIELVPAPVAASKPPRQRRRWPQQPEQACIRCGACEPVCPAQLHPQQMLWFGDKAHDELSNCIECGLCNQVCPSNIDLVSQFHSARGRLAAEAEAATGAALAKARFERRQQRRQHREEDRELRRKARLAGRTARQWQP